MNLGSTVTMTANSRQTSEGQAQTSQPNNQSEPQGQAPPPPPNGASQQTGHGQGTPRVIRITHQTMEPVVMMQMNLDGMSPTHPIRNPVFLALCLSHAAHSWSATLQNIPNTFLHHDMILQFKIVAFKKGILRPGMGSCSVTADH